MPCSARTEISAIDTTTQAVRPEPARLSCRQSSIAEKTLSKLSSLSFSISITSILLAGCGGSGSKPAERPPVDPDPDPGEVYEPTSDIEPEEPPPPPPPREMTARAELAPVKGTKMKPTAVTFFQVEGEPAQVTSDSPFEGLKAGTYHLVIHEAAGCGKNAAGAGAIWETTAAITFPVVVTKKAPGTVEQDGVELMLEGDDSIVGRTLVLHADKKGKPGKAVACGPIATAEAEEPAEDEEAEEEE